MKWDSLIPGNQYLLDRWGSNVVITVVDKNPAKKSKVYCERPSYYDTTKRVYEWIYIGNIKMPTDSDEYRALMDKERRLQAMRDKNVIIADGCVALIEAEYNASVQVQSASERGFTLRCFVNEDPSD